MVSLLPFILIIESAQREVNPLTLAIDGGAETFYNSKKTGNEDRI